MLHFTNLTQNVADNIFCMYKPTRCENLIPRIVTACCWGVESGKLVYSSMFGHVPTCVYMSHRSNDFIRSRAAEEVVLVHGIQLAEK